MQTEEDAKYLKRKIKSGAIDVHPTEQALVINYELEALILGDLGDALLGDKKACQKIIRLENLHVDTDCKALAKQVVDQCSLIHTTKLHEVEQIIYYLQKRTSQTEATTSGRPTITSLNESPRPPSASSSSDGLSVGNAIITNIEEYNELLYEDISQKVKGSLLISYLSRVPDNLCDLGNNESVLSALARVLREDWKQSVDLATNIVFIFYCFSKYYDFHNIILQYKVGSQCMEIIDSELRRYDQLKAELESRRCKSSASTSKTRDTSLIPVTKSDTRRRSADQPNNNEDFQTRKQKFDMFTQKQDQLLRVSFYLLMNIAENTKVEDKMRRKNIVGMLAKTLERDNLELLVLVVSFMRKLSLFRENVDDMRDLNVVELLPRVLAVNDIELTDITLSLLFNLSFETDARERMLRVGFLPKLVTLMSNEHHVSIVIKLLYHLSMDDRCKSMFIYTDFVAMAMDLLTEEPEPEELLALCINLALNKRNAEMMIENNRLETLMLQAFHQQSILLMKLIRNIAQHDSTKEHFIEFVGDIAKAIVESQDVHFVIECVGILGVMTIPDLNFCQIMKEFQLVPWIISNIVIDKHEVDMYIEIVILVGTAAADQCCAELMCKADILISLVDLLNGRQEDDELVLQILYVFHQLSVHSTTLDYMISQTQVQGYIIELMTDKNPSIISTAKNCLELIGEYSPRLAKETMLANFKHHNSQWLDMVVNNVTDDNILGDLDDNNLLDNSIFQSCHSARMVTQNYSTGSDIENQSEPPSLALSD